VSLTQITNIVQGALARGGGWYVEGDAGFTRTLTIGQVLKARILRHYEGGRYLAQIDGQQRVVDSAIPLRVGEVVHGRVTTLDERVHLQRVADVPGHLQPERSSGQSHFASDGQWLDELFAHYQVTLGPQDRATLLRQSARVSEPRLMALGGLVLCKLGTAIRAELLNALYRVFNTSRLREIVSNLETPYSLATSATSARTDSDDAVQQLAGLAASSQLEGWRRGAETRLGDARTETVADTNGDLVKCAPVAGDGAEQSSGEKRDASYGEWLLGHRLLNTQSNGSVSHRLCHFPLWFGDHLVEISVALFSQQESTCSEDGIRHRRLVLSLETANLGHLEVTVDLAGHRLRLQLIAADEVATERLARHLGELKSELKRLGWEIDEIKYVTEAKVEGGAAVRAVLEHHIAQDSLSRLM
jgi:hypothetical protein